MPEYSYRVVPFRAHVKGTAVPGDIAGQLEAAICDGAAGGYELVQVASVTVEVSPGCLGALTGQQASAMTHEQLVFRKLL